MSTAIAARITPIYAARPLATAISAAAPSIGVLLTRAALLATLPDDDRETAGATLLASILGSPPQPTTLALGGGLVGLGIAATWAGQACNESVDLEDIDAILCSRVANGWGGSLGIANGLAGVGLYAIVRHGLGRADELLVRVSKTLAAHAMSYIDGLAWPPEAARAPVDPRSMLASTVDVVATLVEAVRIGAVRDIAFDAIEGGSQWLSAHAHETDVVPRIVAARGARLVRDHETARGVQARLDTIAEANVAPAERAHALAWWQSAAHHAPALRARVAPVQRAVELELADAATQSTSSDWSVHGGLGASVLAHASGNATTPWRMLIGARELEPCHA